MSTPLVSVIVPTRNRVELLRRAIDSVLAQTYEALELIVVDDGSTDGTAAFLATLTDPRLRVLRREQGGGAGNARNEGIAAARGELIAFQDDDDVWLPTKLEEQVRALSAAGPDIGLCLAAYIRWVPGDAWYIGGPAYLPALDFRLGVVAGVNYSLIATPGWLVRRELLNRTGGFDTQMKSWDDLELAMRLSEVCRFVHVEEPLWFQDHVMGGGVMRGADHRILGADRARILEKHGHRWERDRGLMARHCYQVGRWESQYGDRCRARRWFVRGLGYRWHHPRLWLGLALAAIAPATDQAITGFMRRRVRPTWIGRFLYRE